MELHPRHDHLTGPIKYVAHAGTTDFVSDTKPLILKEPIVEYGNNGVRSDNRLKEESDLLVDKLPLGPDHGPRGIGPGAEIE